MTCAVKIISSRKNDLHMRHSATVGNDSILYFCMDPLFGVFLEMNELNSSLSMYFHHLDGYWTK